MHRALLLLTCMTLIVFLSFGSHVKADDELAFEAEDYDSFAAPMQIVEDKDVSGGAYIKSPSGRSGWAEYEIDIPEFAPYYMHGMVQRHDGVTDSFFITFDLNDRGDDDDVNENTWTVSLPDNVWAWDAVNGRGVGGDPRVFELEEGIHMLRIWTRENETWLDCIYMSTDLLAVPILASEFEGRDRKGPPKSVNYSDKLATSWGYIKAQD